MPNYNNFGAYNGGYGQVQNNRVMPQVSYAQPYQQQNPDGRVYVNGRAGADAHPIPMGMNFIVLWDTDAPRFYIKGYDNNGMPRVLEDNDYSAHVDPKVPEQAPVDLSGYATKDDIQTMIMDAFKSVKFPDTSSFVTRYDFDKALSELSVGNGGRIVRANESVQ